MKIFKNGFTVAEMLICLGLISVVVAIMIPAVLSKRPNKNRALFRKSYYNFERIISEIVNEEDLFPSTRGIDYSTSEEEDNKNPDPSTLFAYFIPDDAERALDRNKITIAGKGKTQFERTADLTSRYLCSQIAERMNTNGIVDCFTEHKTLPPDNTAAAEFPITSEGEEEEGKIPAKYSPNFVTNDGVAWFTDVDSTKAICARELQNGVDFVTRGVGIGTCAHELDDNGKDLKFPRTTKSDYTCYEVDVNGPESPNCRRCAEPDRFRFCVTFDGKIEVPITEMVENPVTGQKEVSPTTGHEAEYLRSNKIIE